MDTAACAAAAAPDSHWSTATPTGPSCWGGDCLSGWEPAGGCCPSRWFGCPPPSWPSGEPDGPLRPPSTGTCWALAAWPAGAA